MNIEQGEIWIVKFFPKVGSEISKKRLALVVSHSEIGRLPLKTIVPITDWKSQYIHYPWMVQIKNSGFNGLSKLSAIDCFQVKNFADKRFIKKLGEIDNKLLFRVHETIAKTFNPLYRLF
jgi:mRNA interferase MazF